MPAEPQIDFGPVPPLVIGVTGVMQFEGEDRKAVKQAVTKFLWQFVDGGNTPTGEPVTPTHKDWRPLPSTPVAILTSLAPGADLLLAEVADELEDEFQKRHPGKLAWKFKVFAPTPFPVKQFKQASTFTGVRGSADDKARAKAMLDKLEAEHRAFWVPLKADHEGSEKLKEGMGKEVTQAQLHERRREWLEAKLNEDLTKPPRYRLRYRAAGEYIAAHSHMLLVLNEQVFDGTPTPDEVRVPVASELTGNDFPYGSRLILELKRQGITPELLRSEVAFTWADSGPVIHFYTPKELKPGEPAPTNPPKVGTPTVLYPVDSRTREGNLSYADKNWQWDAGVQFGTVLDQLDSFNQRVAAFAPKNKAKEDGELAEMITLPPTVSATAESPVVREYHRGLDRLARARRRSSDLSNNVYSAEWAKFLRTLFLLTLTAALLVHVAGHWHTHAADEGRRKQAAPHTKEPAAPHADPAHPEDRKPEAKADEPKEGHGQDKGLALWSAAQWWEAGIRTVLVVVAAGLLAWAYIKFLLYKHSRHEDFRYDYRALAEGVRIQVYWAAAGLAQSVPANYMQRQRNEMVWIRRAITALAAPYTRWADGFAALAEADQLAVLKSIVLRWVRWDEGLDPPPADAPKKGRARRSDQTHYMEQAAHKEHRSEYFWKRLGFDLTLMGLFHLVFWVWAVFDHEMFEARDCPVWLIVVAVVSAVLFLGLWGWGFMKAKANGKPKSHQHGFPKAYLWRTDGFWGAVGGGFVWAREVVYFYAYLWEMFHIDRKLSKGMRPIALGVARWVNAAIVVICCTTISAGVCVLLGLFAPFGPAGEVWWAIAYGSMLLAGALAFTWPERHAMAEHARQYESMWAMFQAAGRRLLGHIRAAEEDLAQNDLAQFRGRVKAIQDLLYHVGLQALDENAEWLILHRSRPLEPLMAG